jgi:mono/diheme cytochrome c family protein
MIHKFRLLLLLVTTMFFFGACQHDPVVPSDQVPIPADCDTSSVTYELSVKPILETNCFSCHNIGNSSGGIDLTNYSALTSLAANGKLLGSIRHMNGFSAMPQGADKLSDCDISIIDKWIRINDFKPDDPDPVGCHPDTVYFQNEILPLLISSCGVIGCHDPGTAQDGVVLTDYFSVVNTAGVKPGNPEESDLYEVLTEDDPDKRMPPPPNAPLSQDKIEKIRKWILQGALNNSCEEINCDTLQVSFASHIMPTIQLHCFGCHSGSNPGAGILLTNHSEIAQAAGSGTLFAAIDWQNGYSAMPKNGNKLSDCNITQFKKWIENGTPNN